MVSLEAWSQELGVGNTTYVENSSVNSSRSRTWLRSDLLLFAADSAATARTTPGAETIKEGQSIPLPTPPPSK
jgi:hypothetical protein